MFNESGELPAALKCIEGHLCKSEVGDDTYIRVHTDSELWEQLMKAAPEHILEDVLLRGQLQAGRKRGSGGGAVGEQEGGGGGGRRRV